MKGNLEADAICKVGHEYEFVHCEICSKVDSRFAKKTKEQPAPRLL